MSNIKSDILWRVYLVYFIVAIFAFLIFAKVVYIQLVEGEKWREVASNTTLRYVEMNANRGDVYADDGRLLATSVPVYEIRMDVSPYITSDETFYSKVDSLAHNLSRLFRNRTPREYRQILVDGRNNHERYLLIKRNVSFNELNILREFPLFRKGRFRGGLIVEESTRREMPFRSLAARTIGYERGGYYVGLEGAYRDYLEGIKGKRLMQRTAGGSWMPINDESEISPRNGKDIVTTINVNIQDVVENSLRKQLQRYNADYGTVVVMETATGEIKAISNLTITQEGTYEELFNYAIGESAEPGSTFKLASVLVALDDGVVTPNDFVNTGDGSIEYADRTMHDSEADGFGMITVQKAFEVSSNVGISKIISDHYKDKPQTYIDKLRNMNLGERLGLEISGEGYPVLNDVTSSEWSGVSLPWMSIGYGLSLTPLQTLTFYNAVANDGRMVKPMFVKEIRQTGKTVKKFDAQVINERIASRRAIKYAKEMLVGVVENGTAKNIHTPAYQIAGKTGTAQVANTRFGYVGESGGISYRASFVGFFPADNPQYSMIVVVHNPKGWIFTGSQVAAPVFREISDKIFATQINLHPRDIEKPLFANLPSFRAGNYGDILKVYKQLGCNNLNQPETNWVSAIARADSVNLRDREFIQNLVPNVIGMSLKDALYILENANMEVRFSGIGVVRKQSIRPGLRIQPGQVIVLELS